MNSIAHIRRTDKEIQTVWEHLINVARLSSLYGNKIGVKRLAFLCGLYHDYGKFSTDFKEYIIAESNLTDQSQSKRGSVDHSTAGAKFLFEEFRNKSHDTGIQFITEVISNVVLSHHMGLQDYLSPDMSSNFLRRVLDKELTWSSKIVTPTYKH